MISEEAGRAIVAQRSEDRCEIAIAGVCYDRRHSVHHRLKRSHGGTWAPSNLLAACGDGVRGCHGWVEAHPAESRDLGLWIFTGDGAPDAIAVYMRWHNAKSYWVLDDEGLLHWDGPTFDPLPPGRY